MGNDSTEIKLTPYSEMIIPCIARASIGTASCQLIADFTIDTGAAFTAIPATRFTHMNEQKLIEMKCPTRLGQGISDFTQGSGILFYRIQLSSLSVAGMNFGSVPIYVTFEKGYDFYLLGRDLLELMNFQINNNTHTLTLKKTDRFLRFQKTGVPLTHEKQLFALRQEGSSREVGMGIDVLNQHERTDGGKVKCPVWEKFLLTVEETADYTGIGIKRINDMARTPNCPFVLYVGRKKMIKRKEFEKFISAQVEI